MARKPTYEQLEKMIEELEKLDDFSKNDNVFRLIVERAGEEFYLIKPDGELAYANEAAAKSLGYSLEEMLTLDVSDFDPLFGPVFGEHFKELQKSDMPPFETEHIAKDGRQVLKEIKSVYIRIGTKEYVCAFGRDITERKGMQDKLQASEEKYRRLVENLQDTYFFYSHDTDGIFKYISPSITNILGYSQEEFLAHYTEYLTDSPINEEVVKHTDQSIKGEQQPSYEVEIYHKDGSIKRLEVTEVPVVDAIGNVIAVEGIAQDITGRKSMLEEMERRTRELEEVNAAMKILLKQCSEARWELEEKFSANLKDLILPHLQELELQLSDSRKKVYLNIIKSNLEQITSTFSQNLSLISPNLTPREIQVADLVRNGRTNKEIAELLNISRRTVEFYRENLRSKLDLKNKKVNLRSYLLSQA